MVIGDWEINTDMMKDRIQRTKIRRTVGSYYGNFGRQEYSTTSILMICIVMQSKWVQGWSDTYSTYDLYFPYYYPESYMVIATRVGMLEDNIFSCQVIMFSISNTLKQLLEAVQR